MHVSGAGQGKCFLQHDLPRGAGQQVRASHDIGDALGRVVDSTLPRALVLEERRTPDRDVPAEPADRT